MNRLLPLLTLVLLPQDSKPDRWESAIQAFEKVDRENPPPKGAILFAGSSTIRMWKTAESFPDLPVINRGFGGSGIADTLRYAHRIVLPYQPRLIVFYAGSNDLASGKTPEQAFEDWKAFTRMVHEALPLTRILFIGIKPTNRRWGQRDLQKKLNALVAAHATEDPRRGFLETEPAFLGEDGRPRADLLLPDGLHLNPQGYQVLTALVRPHLVEKK